MPQQTNNSLYRALEDDNHALKKFPSTQLRCDSMSDESPLPDGMPRGSTFTPQHAPRTTREPPGESASNSDDWTDDSSEVSDSGDRQVVAPSFQSKRKPPLTRKCAQCHMKEEDLSQPLKHCVRCKHTLYCSYACQKASWKIHKLLCGSNHFGDLPEHEVYKNLVDAYRLRVEDEYTMTGDVSVRSLYGSANPTRDFQRYLDKAEKRDNVLPSWWNGEKRAACEKMARDRSGNHCIHHAVEKSDIVELYKNPLAPMNLRILGEKIYGKGIGSWGF